jgi:hypothetical protein
MPRTRTGGPGPGPGSRRTRRGAAAKPQPEIRSPATRRASGHGAGHGEPDQPEALPNVTGFRGSSLALLAPQPPAIRTKRDQRRLVVTRVVPWTASTSVCPVSVNPSLASTRREAVFQSQTVAQRRSYPDDLAQSRTANEASVA